jgi:hypothetical protein
VVVVVVVDVVELVDEVVVVFGGFGFGQRSTVKVMGGVSTPMMPMRRRSLRSARAQSLALREGATPRLANRTSEQTVKARVQATGSVCVPTSESRSVRVPTKAPTGDDGDVLTSA